MRAFNLLPSPRVETRQVDGESRGRSPKTIAIAAAAVLVLVAVLLGFAFVQGRSDVSDRRATLGTLEAQVARAQAAASLSATTAARTQAHLLAVTSASSGRTAWDNLLNQLGHVMPSGAWLESLQASGAASATSTATTSTTATVSAAPTGFVVSGYALSQNVVARALDRLALIPALSDVSLQSTQRAEVAGKKAVQFTIGANVRAGGGNG